MNFKEFKAEILSRAKMSNACSGEYERAENSNNFAQLIKVLTDNFAYACDNKIIDVELLEKVGAEICNANNLFFNCNTSIGYLLASDSATVEACGSATVRACGSATVRAYDSATVKAYDSATVRACGSATVRAYDSATVKAYDSATVKAFGSATVEACGSAYICSYNDIEHKLSDKSILRYYYQNKVVLADLNSLSK